MQESRAFWMQQGKFGMIFQEGGLDPETVAQLAELAGRE